MLSPRSTFSFLVSSVFNALSYAFDFFWKYPEQDAVLLLLVLKQDTSSSPPSRALSVLSASSSKPRGGLMDDRRAHGAGQGRPVFYAPLPARRRRRVIIVTAAEKSMFLLFSLWNWLICFICITKRLILRPRRSRRRSAIVIII